MRKNHPVLVLRSAVIVLMTLFVAGCPSLNTELVKKDIADYRALKRKGTKSEKNSQLRAAMENLNFNGSSDMKGRINHTFPEAVEALAALSMEVLEFKGASKEVYEAYEDECYECMLDGRYTQAMSDSEKPEATLCIYLQARFFEDPRDTEYVYSHRLNDKKQTRKRYLSKALLLYNLTAKLHILDSAKRAKRLVAAGVEEWVAQDSGPEHDSVVETAMVVGEKYMNGTTGSSPLAKMTGAFAQQFAFQNEAGKGNIVGAMAAHQRMSDISAGKSKVSTSDFKAGVDAYKEKSAKLAREASAKSSASGEETDTEQRGSPQSSGVTSAECKACAETPEVRAAHSERTTVSVYRAEFSIFDCKLRSHCYSSGREKGQLEDARKQAATKISSLGSSAPPIRAYEDVPALNNSPRSSSSEGGAETNNSDGPRVAGEAK